MRRSTRRSFFAVAALVAAAAVFGLAAGCFAPGVAASPDAAIQAEGAPVDCCITRPASSCCRIGRRLASTADLFPPPPPAKPSTAETTTTLAAAETTTAAAMTAAAMTTATAPAYDCCKTNPAGSCCRLGRRLASVAEEPHASASTTEAPADCCATNPAGSCCRLGRRRLSSVVPTPPAPPAKVATVPVKSSSSSIPTTTLNAAESAIDCCKTNPAGSCCRLGK